MDLFGFSSASTLNDGSKNKCSVSLETFLISCDFNTSAISYDFNKKVINEYGALNGINRREIDSLDNASDEKHVMMSRLILHSDKLGFSIGPKGMKLIAEEYRPSLDSSIRNYLHYKCMEDKKVLVLEKIRQIANYK